MPQAVTVRTVDDVSGHNRQYYLWMVSPVITISTVDVISGYNRQYCLWLVAPVITTNTVDSVSSYDRQYCLWLVSPVITVKTVNGVSGYNRQECGWRFRSTKIVSTNPVSHDNLSFTYQVYIYVLQANLFPNIDFVFGTNRAGSGGCFPLHYDNPGPPNKRALTCLLYLNPHWKEGDGGEVCLTPFLQKEKAIAPLLDRLVGACAVWVHGRWGGVLCFFGGRLFEGVMVLVTSCFLFVVGEWCWVFGDGGCCG